VLTFGLLMLVEQAVFAECWRCFLKSYCTASLNWILSLVLYFIGRIDVNLKFIYKGLPGLADDLEVCESAGHLLLITYDSSILMYSDQGNINCYSFKIFNYKF